MTPKGSSTKVVLISILSHLQVLVFPPTVSALSSSSSHARVTLSSTSPIVLDATITFTAAVQNLSPYDTGKLLVFRWSDNASPAHWREQETNATSMNLSLTYSSKEYEAKWYTMTVMVFVTRPGGYRDKISVAETRFELTKFLNGHLLATESSPSEEKDEFVVSTGKDIDFEMQLYDPSYFLHNSRIQCFFSVNDTNYGQSDDQTFTYKFSEPGKSLIEVNVIAYMNTSLDERRKESSLSTVVLPPSLKSGMFRTRVDARRPLTVLNVTGNTWLKHGQLLDLEVTCDGSGPWRYCWSIKQNGYNVSGQETCLDPQAMVTDCSFPVVWYFRDAGIYDVLLVLSNGVSIQRELVHINVYKIIRQPELVFIVVPIVGTMLAGLLVLVVLICFVRFRKNIAIETADFDFNNEDEEYLDERKSFFQRLRDSMMSTFNSSSDTVSHVSSVSSRSVQPTAVGIHYGSIT